MSFISQSHNLPAVGRFLYRYLLRADDHQEAESRLVELLAPAGLPGVAGGGPERAGGFASEHTIGALGAIGFLDVASGLVRLGGALTDEERAPADPDRCFASVVRRLVLRGSTGAQDWEHTPSGWRTEGGSDFVRAVTWLLAQDVLGEPLRFGGRGAHNAEARQTDQFRGTGVPKLIANETQWDNFVRWAPVLGLARRVYRSEAAHLVPDPTDALKDVLANRLAGSLREWRPVGAVLEEVYEELPVLGRGVHREAMRSLLRDDPNPDLAGGAEPSSVSQALLYLDETRFIELANRSDAEVVILDDRPRPRRVSHIRISGTA